MAGSTDQFGNDAADYTTDGAGSVQSQIEASLGINSGWSFTQPKSADTATTNAVQSMAPVTASSSASDSGWSSFWQGTLGSIVKTGTAVVAAKNGVVQPANTTPVVVTPSPNPNRVLLLLALGVGVVLLAQHKG